MSDSIGGQGGDLGFKAGLGGVGSPDIPENHGKHGDIVFWVADDFAIMRFCPNGDIFVKGKLIENDKEVVDGFREFLTHCK